MSLLNFTLLSGMVIVKKHECFLKVKRIHMPWMRMGRMSGLRLL